MLTLITGQPGNGKTLWMLGEVEALRKETQRAVYYWNVRQLTLPWEAIGSEEDWDRVAAKEIDGAGCDWYERPSGSIIVIDECQHVFPPRKQGAAVPVRVSQFETHRHKGFDIYLVTQHPQLLDIAVRKLVGRHYHVTRKFGRGQASVQQWERCVDPHDRSVQKDALRKSFKFPSERFGWYRSAEVHTVRKDFPVKPVAVLAGATLAVVGLGWFTAHRLSTHSKDIAAATAPKDGEKSKPILEAVDIPQTWATEAFLPRSERWQWSAPFYDRIARVQSAPRIIGCMEMKIGPQRVCRCSNGQGDADVSPQVCRDYMRGRWWDPARQVEDAKAANIRYLEGRDAGMVESSGGSSYRAPPVISADRVSSPKSGPSVAPSPTY